ncbi:hypothetical protein Ancab_035767 [Ancistrocladus abbreviatus]
MRIIKPGYHNNANGVPGSPLTSTTNPLLLGDLLNTSSSYRARKGLCAGSDNPNTSPRRDIIVALKEIAKEVYEKGKKVMVLMEVGLTSTAGVSPDNNLLEGHGDCDAIKENMRESRMYEEERNNMELDNDVGLSFDSSPTINNKVLG